MKTFEVWDITNGNNNYKYDSDSYKFYTEQLTLDKAILKVKEIFKNKYNADLNIIQKNSYEIHFTSSINGVLRQYEMFELFN